MYRHTQIGYLTLVALLGSVGIVLGMGSIARTAALVIGGLLAVIGFIFSTLTIEIRDGTLRSWFGPGVWRKEWPVREITDASVGRSNFIEGWGIRFTPRGMLYNVSGFAVIEVTLLSGTRFRLGTDEPERLVAAIRQASR